MKWDMAFRGGWGSSSRSAAVVSALFVAFGLAGVFAAHYFLVFSTPASRTRDATLLLTDAVLIAFGGVLMFILVWRISAGRTRHLLRRAADVSRMSGIVERLATDRSRGFAAGACAALRQATGADGTAFLAADEVQGVLLPEALDGFADAEAGPARARLTYRLAEAPPFLADLVARRRPAYLGSREESPGWLPPAPALRASYWIPLVYGDRLQGVLAMFARSLEGFGPPERALADLVASLVALAIEQSRLSASESLANRAYRDLVERSPAGIFTIGLDGRLLSTNPAIAESTGFTGPRELLAAVGERPQALFADPGTYARLLAALRTEGHLGLFEAETVGRHGKTRWMLMTAHTVTDEQGLPLYYQGTSVDITARRQAERTLQDATTQLQHLDRLSALGEMASAVAHDFNNALTPVVGYSEFLKDPGIVRSNPEAVSRYAELISQGAADAARIVERLRSLYKPKTAPARRTVDLGDAAQEVAELTRPRWLTQAGVTGRLFTLRVERGGPAIVVGDAQALREALTNLVFNAVDACPKGGEIVIRTGTRVDGVMLAVTDSGTGMTEEVRSRCLEPFYSTKGEFGTGLGLASVHRIVSEHDGRLEIDSAPGRGSTFTLLFPAGADARRSAGV